MENKHILMAVGIGMVAGGALGMAVAPKKRSDSRRMISRALRGMGSVIDDVSSLMGK